MRHSANCRAQQHIVPTLMYDSARCAAQWAVHGCTACMTTNLAGVQRSQLRGLGAAMSAMQVFVSLAAARALAGAAVAAPFPFSVARPPLMSSNLPNCSYFCRSLGQRASFCSSVKNGLSYGPLRTSGGYTSELHSTARRASPTCSVLLTQNGDLLTGKRASSGCLKVLRLSVLATHCWR